MTAPIYLDYAATTPIEPTVARAMSAALNASASYGNAASVTHAFGRRAAARIEAARAQVASLIGAPAEDIVFTSGATEANNLAILGMARANADRKRHIITSRIEHKAVLDPCKQLEREGFTVTYLAPNANGQITPDAVEAWLRPDTALVSIMHVNNETGVIQDIRAIGALCRARGVPFHTDGAQSVGKLPIRVREDATTSTNGGMRIAHTDVEVLPVDMLSFTAHKIYGPQGIGALYVRPDVRPLLRAVTFGGGQERGLRPGTLALHQIVGFGVACEIAAWALVKEPARLTSLRDRLWQSLQALGGVHLNGEGAPRVPEILNVSFEGVEGESLVTGLTSLAVTTGSACNSASGEPSYVLRALGRGTELAQSSLRFSFGRATTDADVDHAAAAVIAQVEKLRRVSPASSSAEVAGDASNASARRQPAARSSVAADTRAPARSGAPVERRVNARRAEDRLAAEYAAIETLAGRSEADLDTLSPLARKYFDELPHAGVLTADGDGKGSKGTQVVRGEAGSITDGAWVRFHLRVADGSVKAALFQAWGCPHTLAVTAWLTEQLPGRSLTDLVPGSPAAWLKALDVPVEKLGRLLTVEDALNATLQPPARAP
jgi:cysteine desulfurase